MNTRMMFFLWLLMTGLLGDTANRVLAQDDQVAAAKASADPAATALAGTVCPRYIWMNHGSYYSYYSQRANDCVAVNLDSTSNSLSTSGDCTNGMGCISTLVAKDERGERVNRANDPGVNGYGHGLPAGGEGRKRYVLERGPNNRPWPRVPPNSSALTVQHVDDFEIDFLSPDGKTTLQAQVMVVKAKITGSSDPMVLIGRAIEIHPRPAPLSESPTAGTVGSVTPIPNRPHAFTFDYTPSAGGPAVPIEIITHHEVPGHTK